MTITVTASLIHSYLENATLDTFVISDPGMKENDMDAVVRRITRTFSSKRYIDRLTGSKKNWIGILFLFYFVKPCTLPPYDQKYILLPSLYGRGTGVGLFYGKS